MRHWSLLAAVALVASTGATMAGRTTAASVPTPVTRPFVGPGVPPQRLATLLVAHEAYLEPTATAQPLQLVEPRRPLTGERTGLPVLAAQGGAKGTYWLHVMLPGRPDGRTGWIDEAGTLRTTTSFAVVVNTAKRELIVYQFGRPVRSTSVVVGKPLTPTPIGRFFVEEVVRLPSTAVGAPYAFALSARSNVLQEFDGGPGQIALHGLGNIGGVPGTAESHGCVRLESAMLTWMVTRIGPGVPVTVESGIAVRGDV
jgi:lipoprotein-anchoring transpeptidase ErfK/SrfK